MIWDRVAPLYDLAVNTLNRRVYDGTGTAVARLIRPGDTVLECACGTGAISAAIAPANTDILVNQILLQACLKDISDKKGKKK